MVMKNWKYRKIARMVLIDRGYDVSVKPGQGHLPGSRLIAVKAGRKLAVAVKVAHERAISFARQSEHRWRTLHAVDLVVVVVPVKTKEGGADVIAFEKDSLTRMFDLAWSTLAKAKLQIGLNLPVFIPIDDKSRKNVGHGVAGLKRLAMWSVHLAQDELTERSERPDEDYVLEFRRRYAAEKGVDIDKVEVRILEEKRKARRH